jgi:hypothetical protein
VPVAVVAATGGWTIATAVATIVLAAGVLFAFWQLRDAQKSRHAALATDLSRRWDEPALLKAQEAFSKATNKTIRDQAEILYADRDANRAKYDETVPAFLAMQALPNFLEHIGSLEKQGAIPLPVVDDLWGGAILVAWRHWRDAVQLMRDETGRETIYEDFRVIAGWLGVYRACGQPKGLRYTLFRWHRRRRTIKAHRAKVYFPLTDLNRPLVQTLPPGPPISPLFPPRPSRV